MGQFKKGKFHGIGRYTRYKSIFEEMDSFADDSSRFENLKRDDQSILTEEGFDEVSGDWVEGELVAARRLPMLK